jgi:hypothetical protein
MTKERLIKAFLFLFVSGCFLFVAIQLSFAEDDLSGHVINDPLNQNWHVVGYANDSTSNFLYIYWNYGPPEWNLYAYEKRALSPTTPTVDYQTWIDPGHVYKLDMPSPSVDMWRIISLFMGSCSALAFAFAAQKVFL